MAMATALEPREQQPQLGAASEQQQPAPPAAPLKRLTCAVQNYAWGRHAQDSEVRPARVWPAAGGGSRTERRQRPTLREPPADALAPLVPPAPRPARRSRS